MYTVDVRNAGDGMLEISICGPSGQNLSNNVTAQGPGLFLVNYVPVECGQHRANVTFNKENIRGSLNCFLYRSKVKRSLALLSVEKFTVLFKTQAMDLLY